MQRRAFLKHTALGGAALVAPALAQEAPVAEENANPNSPESPVGTPETPPIAPQAPAAAAPQAPAPRTWRVM